MRFKALISASVLVGAAALALGGCAAPMGTVAGDVVGGAGWAAMKGGSYAFKGGKLAVKTTGRTVVGAARGVHEEFSPGQESAAADDGQSQTYAQADDYSTLSRGKVSSAEEDQAGEVTSQREAAALPY